MDGMEMIFPMSQLSAAIHAEKEGIQNYEQWHSMVAGYGPPLLRGAFTAIHCGGYECGFYV